MARRGGRAQRVVALLKSPRSRASLYMCSLDPRSVSMSTDGPKYVAQTEPRGSGVAETAVVTDAPQEACGGTETIVLVEDEDGLRSLIREVLEDAGYRVIDAPDPERGLAAVRGEKGGVHILMTDVILPQMRGTELAERVRQISPDVRVLFMSGYTDQAIGPHAGLSPGAHFLQKPFSLTALLEKVRVVMDSPPEPSAPAV
jgi:two-component system, cell cycle sensor histidine kinase and response regulator CckA